jgi:hypothetical protein
MLGNKQHALIAAAMIALTGAIVATAQAEPRQRQSTERKRNYILRRDRNAGTLFSRAAEEHFAQYTQPPKGTV